MIAFEDLVAALERSKLRKLASAPTGAPAAQASKAVSGKQAQQQQERSSADLQADDLISDY